MKLSTDDFRRIAAQSGSAPPCKSCSTFAYAGWEAFPATASDAALVQVGTMALPGDDEPTLDEYHPDGSNYWSAAAPIALDFHPYNRCELWQCRDCGHPFLRYTEYGGYYEERRIRDLNPALIV
ncbi:hypothetical protein BH10PSE16_BH10PSE16_24720 [soil metagenome]